MCKIRWWYWHSCQYPSTIDQKLLSILQVPKKSWPQTQHSQVPIWSTRSIFPRRFKNNQGSSPTKAKDCQTSRKSQISTVQASTSMINWIFELLAKLYTWIGRTIHSIFSTTQNNECQKQKSDCPWHNKTFQGSKRSFIPILPTGTSSTTTWQTIGPHNRCNVWSSWLCSVKLRWSKPATHFNTQKLRSYSLWFKGIHSIPKQNVRPSKKTNSHLSGLQLVWTYNLVCNQTCDYFNRKHISY